VCQGQLAPDVAGVELGVAEWLAARAVAQVAGVPAEQVLAGVRDTGDLGLAARAAARLAGRRPVGDPGGRGGGPGAAPGRRGAGGAGSQGRKLAGLVGRLERATPLEGR